MGFNNNDITKVKKIENICKELFLLNENLSCDICLNIVQNLIDNRQILEKEL
jgi:hypothetical protein